MRIFTGIAAIVGLIACGSAQAGVDGVVTASTAVVTFKPDGSGSNIVYNYSGDQLAGGVGSNAFGSGASFASTSKLEPNQISFQNGNASAGEYAYTSSQTDLDITFTNDSDSAVIPQLRSDIIPAGFGVFVGNKCLSSLTSCNPIQAYNFQDFKSNGPDYRLAGTSIDFKILGDGATIYDLTASIDLVYDPITQKNVFVDNISQAQDTLSSFGLETRPGSQTAYGFNWEATPIDVNFPSGSLLLPGQSGTLTYQTTVSSYSRALCTNATNSPAGGCLIAYSAFGDPIGGSPGIKPEASLFGLNALALDAGLIDTVSYGTFALNLPTFQDGVLTLRLASVPEPGAWVLLISGGGLIGAALRRRRARSPLEDPTATAS